MILRLRTKRTGAHAGALWMFGTDCILVRVPVIVRGWLTKAIFVVALVIEEKVRAACIEVFCERFGTVGSLDVGVYLLEGWRQRGLVGGAITMQRAGLEGARGLRKSESEGEMSTHCEREEGWVLLRAGVGWKLEHAGDLLADVSKKGVEGGRSVGVAGVLGRKRLPGRRGSGLSGRVGHACGMLVRRWWERERRVRRQTLAVGRTPTVTPPCATVTRLAHGV